MFRTGRNCFENFSVLQCFVFWLMFALINCGHYLNKFAVHIPGGERVAREVAETHGYYNLGQVCRSINDHEQE